MPKFKVMLARTTIDHCEVEVTAPDADRARDLAIDNFIGQHDWQDQETIDICVADCEELK
jgi:hypothetical protein